MNAIASGEGAGASEWRQSPQCRPALRENKFHTEIAGEPPGVFHRERVGRL